MSKNSKNSLLAGALTGTVGIFITKIISLLYVIPFNEIALSETVYYSYGYSVYNILLELCLSGIPFAVATLVAKYNTKGDKATVKLVRKISSILIISVGFIFACLLVVFITPITMKILPDGVDELVITKTKNVLMIISVALIFVPLLSFYRGFYQGMKDIGSYSFSQVLEQLVRVIFLLSAGLFCVYGLNLKRIWAVYMAVAGASVGAIVTIIYYLFYDRKMREELKDVGQSSYTNKEVFIELVKTSIPYLISTLLSNSLSIIILFFFSDGMQAYGYDNEEIVLMQGLINYQVAKLISIPVIIMSGFSLNVIPFITEALTNNDNKRVQELVTKIITSQFYFTIPICLFMCCFSREVFYIMYGIHDIDLGTSLLVKALLQQIVINVMCITTTTMLALQMRKRYLILEFSRIVLMALTFYPMLKQFGVDGYFLATVLGELLVLIVGLFLINKEYEIDGRGIIKDVFKVLICCIPMLLIYGLHKLLSINIISLGRIPTFMFMGFEFIVLIGLYLLLSFGLRIGQQVFEITSVKEVLNKLFGRFFKK